MKNCKILSQSAIILGLLFIMQLQGCSGNEQSLTQAYVNPDLLLNATELEGLLATNPDLLVIDARAETPETVISGAVHFSAIAELTDPEHSIQGYLIGPELFQQKMRSLGMENSNRVVIYDEGNNLASARLFYAFDYYGFNHAALLNGGLEAWMAAGNELTDRVDELPEGNFTVDVQESLMCDFDYVTQASSSADVVIFDARSAGEYTGEDVRAERGGHIPNAVNLEWDKVLAEDGIPYFLPAEKISVLFQEFGITPDKEIIPHCQSNVRGSHAYFTLRLMGYDSVRPYEGSWLEYGNRQDAEITQ